MDGFAAKVDVVKVLLWIDAFCMAFFARSEEAGQSHYVHKLALVNAVIMHILR